MKKKEILIWSTAISDLLDGNAAGIGVQLYFWSQTFARHGWQVTTLTRHHSFTSEGVSFKRMRNWGKLRIIQEWIEVFFRLLFFRPHIVISRGADRIGYPLAIISKWLRIKYICFGASDVNFEIGKELSHSLLAT